MVTNDDGIDSVGLHVLARAMNRHGEVLVVAPDREYSGASSAVGALHIMQPEVHKAHIDGMKESWALSGPPALCVMFARLGLFGAPFDLVVAGINPGANVAAVCITREPLVQHSLLETVALVALLLAKQSTAWAWKVKAGTTW